MQLAIEEILRLQSELSIVDARNHEKEMSLLHLRSLTMDLKYDLYAKNNSKEDLLKKYLIDISKALDIDFDVNYLISKGKS